MATLIESGFLRSDEALLGEPVEWSNVTRWPYGYGPYFLTTKRIITRIYDPFLDAEEYRTFWEWEEGMWVPQRLETGVDDRLYLTVDQHGEERVVAMNGLYVEEV